MPADAFRQSTSTSRFPDSGQQMGGWIGFRSRSYIRSTRVPLCPCPKRLQFSSSGEEGIRLFYAVLRFLGSAQTDDCWRCWCTTQFKEEEDTVADEDKRISLYYFLYSRYYKEEYSHVYINRVSLHYFLFSRGILSYINRLYTNNRFI